MLPFIFFIFMLVSLGFLIHFNYHPEGYKMPIVKTITSLLFIAVCLSSYNINQNGHTYFLLILIALIMSLIGDIFLAFNDTQLSHISKMFILGLTSFAIAHIFFSFSFIKLTPILKRDIFVFIIIATISVISVSLLKNIKGFNFKGAFSLVITYSIVISFMVSRSLSLISLTQNNFLGTILIIIGAGLFFISDLILCFIYFYKKCPSYMTALNLLCYYIGQGLIALSLAV